MILKEDDAASAYRVRQQRSAESQIWRAYLFFGIPLSIATFIFALKLDPENFKFVYGAPFAPLAIIGFVVYLARLASSDRHEWEITATKLHFRSPRSGSTDLSRILWLRSTVLQDFPGYHLLTVLSRSGQKESIILSEQICPSAQMRKLLNLEPGK